MRERIRNYLLLIRLLPVLAVSAERRRLLAEMMAFCRRLPQVMQQPLPDVMAAVVSDAPELPGCSEGQVRALADLASALERRSVPGICLRRSLTRYRFLAAFELPFEVVFGARLVPGADKRELNGHAWLEKEGEAYFESAENYEDFTPMFRWPPASSPQSQSQVNGDQSHSESPPLES